MPSLLQSQRPAAIRCSAPWDGKILIHTEVWLVQHCAGAAAPSLRNQDSAYDQGALCASLIMLMSWFVMANTSTFSFKSINIPEQSFWKEALVGAVMIHASVK